MRWPGFAYWRCELHRAAEEVEPHHRRLAALPGHHDLRRARMSFEELSDVGLLQLCCHAETASRVEHLLGQKEAVLAVQVADGARRLGHDVEGEGGRRHREQRSSGLGGSAHWALDVADLGHLIRTLLEVVKRAQAGRSPPACSVSAF